MVSTILTSFILAAIVGQSSDAVADLIRQLGADDAAVREEAERKLGETGEPAEAALKEAVKSVDPEIRERAGHVLDRIVRLRQDREFGERFHALAITFGNRRCGSLSMKTRIEREGDQEVLVFEDHVGAWCQARCAFSLDPPRIESFSWTMRDSGEVTMVGGERLDRRIEISLSNEGIPGSHVEAHDLPPRFFAAYEYYRLACVIRRAEGEVFRFTQFVVDPEGELFRASELRCIGRERVGDEDPWRIEYWRAGSRTPEMTRLSTLWVTDDGELVQVQPQDGKVLPVEK